MSDAGNAALIHKIQEEIRQKGRITFARFMEMALYDPEEGYYTSPGERIGLGVAGRHAVGMGVMVDGADLRDERGELRIGDLGGRRRGVGLRSARGGHQPGPAGFRWRPVIRVQIRR